MRCHNAKPRRYQRVYLFAALPVDGAPGGVGDMIPDEITRYISKIKNHKKKEYAKQYISFRCCSGSKPTYSGSYMGGQAVRLTIDSILMAYGIEV